MKTKMTKKELESQGLVVNPNMWLGSGWMHCKVCKKYTYHYAMSHKGQNDCYEICRESDTYSK